MRIVFMGTPQFAVPSLEMLHEAGYDIVGVVTSPDKMGGRGRKTLIESDVKKTAQKLGLKILQPKNLKSESFLDKLRELNADLQIVVAFRMLPESVWNMPPLGTYNLHGSLLPKYRGAAPINWAIIKGDTVTGVTSFKLKHAIDTGSIAFQKEIPILDDENATALHDKMMAVAADIVLKTVQHIEDGTIELTEQDDSQVSHAPKLTRDNTLIDFTMEAKKVHDFIRGLSYYPGAWFDMAGESVKVYGSSYSNEKHAQQPGTIDSDNKTYIRIYCRIGYIELLNIKYPGKKRMEVSEFLNGFDIESLNL